MNLKAYISQRIEELDATGNKKAAVEYFTQFVPNVTRQMINGWKKTQRFPFEAAEAICEQEMDEATDEAELVTEDRRSPRTAAEARAENEPPPSSMEAGDGATLAPHEFPTRIVSPLGAQTRRPARRDGIQVVQRRGEPAPGPEMVLPDGVDLNALTQVVTQSVLAALGRAPQGPVATNPVRQERRVAAAPPPAGARPRVRMRNWNEPPPAPPAR